MENYPENNAIGKNQRNYVITDIVTAFVSATVLVLGMVFLVRLLFF